MAIPLSPDPNATYWGTDPTAAPPADDDLVSQYWGLEPVNAVAPYQPNPGAPGYNPNPGSAPAQPGAMLGAGPAVPPEQRGVIGRAGAAVAKAFSDPAPLFQNPLGKAQQPIDLGEIDVVDGGKIDAPPAKKDVNLTGIGPTAADDAALATLNAKLSAPKSMPKVGAPANPDPYGILAAQKAQLGAFDSRMAAMTRAANAEQDRDFKRAEHAAVLARMQEEDAAIGRAEHEYATKLFDEQMTELGRQLDDVKTRKVDPLKDFKESPALGVLAVVGGAVGGFFQGLSGGSKNEFLETLERHIDRGVAEQERQIRDEKWTLSEGANMLHQQRQAQKDDLLAKAQLRNLTYEAVKNEIAAEAERDGTDIGRANADAAIALVAGQQADLQRQIGEQKRSQAMAAAAMQHARAKEVQTAIFNQYEKNLASGMPPGQAVDWARYLIGQVYGVPGAPGRPADDPAAGVLTKEHRSKITMEHGEAQHVSDSFNAQIDAMRKHPALDGLGLTTGAASHFGQRAAPESAKTVQDLNEINTAIINAIGKVAKDAEGKPNVLMMERYEHRFSIDPTDTKEIALQKLEGARNVVNRLAQQQGAAVPQSSTEVRASLGAKPVGR